MVVVRNDWGDLVSEIAKIWEISEARRVIIVTDVNVEALYAAQIWESLSGGTNWHLEMLTLPAGEAAKDFGNLGKILTIFHEAGLDRSSLVFALGGGVISDIAGFAASIYMRGIDYVNLPTTLLAQVDASIGGKTAIDFAGVKNLIGSFRHPRLIYANLATLDSLPRREFISGLSEVVKYGIIKDRALLDFLHENKEAITMRGADALAHIVARCCAIKSEIVAADEKEANLRQILNFGHTFGHAIESLLNFSLPHGHAVSLGMVCALDYSVRHLGLSAKEADFAAQLLEGFGLPTALAGLCPEEIYAQMLKDKKARNGQLTLILTPQPGQAEIVRNPARAEVLRSIKTILRG
ncbi:MAG: 3-dehydroquinate synthase [Clostridiales bacterium]|nr:3-dehydroquinate synthase [Clostridiales bacterium]